MSEGSGLGRQVDLGQDKMLSGVMIQGGKHRDKNVFMKRFRLGHSLDGEDWAVFREDNSTKPKVGVRPRGGRGCVWVGGLPEALRQMLHTPQRRSWKEAHRMLVHRRQMDEK